MQRYVIILNINHHFTPYVTNNMNQNRSSNSTIKLVFWNCQIWTICVFLILNTYCDQPAPPRRDVATSLLATTLAVGSVRSKESKFFLFQLIYHKTNQYQQPRFERKRASILDQNKINRKQC